MMIHEDEQTRMITWLLTRYYLSRKVCWSRPRLCAARFRVLQPRIRYLVGLLAYLKSKLFRLFVPCLCSRMCPSMGAVFLLRFAQTPKTISKQPYFYMISCLLLNPQPSRKTGTPHSPPVLANRQWVLLLSCQTIIGICPKHNSGTHLP
jgi:hypothetical protein